MAASVYATLDKAQAEKVRLEALAVRAQELGVQRAERFKHLTTADRIAWRKGALELQDVSELEWDDLSGMRGATFSIAEWEVIE